jgi:hypothetical protein
VPHRNCAGADSRTARPPDVDRELVLLFMIFDENKSYVVRDTGVERAALK